VCFEGILVRLVTGCSWVDVEYLLGGRVSDTTLRARRDEWIEAGVFDRLADEAIASYLGCTTTTPTVWPRWVSS
jgi:hypothetical protein